MKYLTFETYTQLADVYGLNDFLFSSVLDKEIDSSQLDSLEKTAHLLLNDDKYWSNKFSNTQQVIDFFIEIRNKIIPEYLEFCLQKILEFKPTLVGFTCLFDQTFPSLAMAKMLREKTKSIFIAFGGYAVENETGRELIERFDFIDTISQGAGENKIVMLAQVSVKKQELKNIPGIFFRENGLVKETIDKPMDINESKCPEFSDYFNDLTELDQKFKVRVRSTVLPYEASRGCWWGQKNHCVFCGIDDFTMKYKLKNWEKVLYDFKYISKKYKTDTIRLVDYIISLDYFNNLIPALKNENLKISCETKANLKKEQLVLLKESGFKEIQPGIESFSTRVLNKMKKGTNLLQNVFFIKFSFHLDLIVHYNLLYDFPWDEEEDYFHLLYTIPSLYHLPPPHSTVPVAITRYAPLSQESAFSLNGEKKPHFQYDSIFSKNFLKKNGFKFSNYAYYFEKNYSKIDKIQKLQILLQRQITNWKNVFHNSLSSLSFETQRDQITFTDSRAERKKEITFGSEHKKLYEAINDKISDPYLVAKNLDIPDHVTNLIIKDFLDNRLIIREGNKCLGLALSEIERPANNHLKEVALMN